MCGKWMCLFILDLIILADSIPGRFYDDFHTDTKQQWGWSQGWSNGWSNGWYNGPTTQGARTKSTTITQATVEAKSPHATPSQPTISDFEIRLGDLNATTPKAPSSQLIQNETITNIQLQAFAPGPIDDGPGDLETSSLAVSTEKAGADSVDILEPNTKMSLWHVAIYEKKEGQLDHICGGSLVKEDIVISAAHCFWSPIWQELPTTRYTLAAGKIYSQYDDPRDTNAQYSDIKNISITEMEEPCRQPDLAILNLVTPFKFTGAVMPVCLNFGYRLKVSQLKEGNSGMVATWSVQENGECKPSQELNWLSLRLVNEEICQVDTVTFKTTGRDRICAGETNNGTHCETDSGNALVFYKDTTPYLRGVTTNVIENRECTKFNTRSFTDIIGKAKNLERAFKHIFDKLNLSECESYYTNLTTQVNDPNQEDVTEGLQAGFGEGFVPVDPPDNVGGFGIASIGSLPVPTLLDTSAPLYQWHVGIYSKSWTPYMQICGGSLVKRDFVISAAHCFWDDASGQQPASQFAVAGGKLFRPWNNTRDTYAQQSDVSQITMPARFRGATTSFQDDIAILRLSTPFTYAPGVQSVCVSFNYQFEREQLQPDNRGTILGWGLTKENGGPSQRLTYLQLPYVDIEKCFADSDPAFMKYITSDKICAGDTVSGKALCRGDSGGGFVVYSDSTPYLHGVASTAAGNENLCNAFALAAFTSLYSHRTFIRDNIPDIDKECKSNADATTDRNADANEATGNAGLAGNGPAGIDENGSTGIGVPIPVVGIGNAGLMTGGTRTENTAVGASPAFSQFPYYPSHFVCNCNCKP